jgi:hypothetical protein
MDVIAPVEGGTAWRLPDPARSPDREHHRERLPSIHDLPRGHALETAAGIQQGPHASLDAALAEIENRPGASAGAILAKVSLRRRGRGGGARRDRHAERRPLCCTQRS